MSPCDGTFIKPCLPRFKYLLNQTELCAKADEYGIRRDAAKHIGLPSEGCDFWPAVTSVEGLWHYGEILDNPAGSNAGTEAGYRLLNEYAKYMSVTDNEYASTCLSSVKSWILPSAAGNLSGGVPASKLVYWGESHDTYSNDGGATKGTMQARIDRVYLLSACREDKTLRLSLKHVRRLCTDAQPPF